MNDANAPALTDQDASQLHALAICYYLFAALGVLSLLILAGVGTMVFGPSGILEHSHPIPADARAALIAALAFGGLIVALGMVLHFLAGQRLRQRRSRGLCQFAAAVTCLSIPLGTALGVCTFVVLARPQVRAAFGDPA